MSATKKTANKATLESGLNFNVVDFKRLMVETLNNSNMRNTKTDPDTSEVTVGNVTMMGAHVAVTAAVQSFVTYVVNGLIANSKKDKSGLTNIDYSNVNRLIDSDKCLSSYFRWRVDTLYNSGTNYSKQLPTHFEKEFKAYVSTLNGSLKFDTDGFNLLNFMIVSLYENIVTGAFKFMTGAGKKTMNRVAITTIIHILLSDKLYAYLLNDINKTSAEDDAKDEDQDGADAEAAEEEAPAKGKGGKGKKAAATPAPKGKGKGAKAKVEAEPEEADAEEVATKPAKKGKGKGAKAAAKEEADEDAEEEHQIDADEDDENAVEEVEAEENEDEEPKTRKSSPKKAAGKKAGK